MNIPKRQKTVLSSYYINIELNYKLASIQAEFLLVDVSILFFKFVCENSKEIRLD